MSFSKRLLHLFLIFAPATGLAVNYQIWCQEGSLTIFSGKSGSADQQQCLSYKNQGMLSCGDSKSKLQTEGLMLKSPVDSYFSSRGGIYSTLELRGIIRKAINEGIDPYLALAISTVENPATVGEKDRGYPIDYGRPPIDQTGVIGLANCHWVGGNLENGDDVIPEFDLGHGSVREDGMPTHRSLFEVEPNNEPGMSPFVYLVGDVGAGKQRSQSQKCQIIVNHYNGNYSDLYGTFATAFITQKFAAARSFGFVKGIKDPYLKMSSIVQSYNGYGRVGRSEKVRNSCIQGIDMKRQPLYGAGVMDLYLNMFVANSDVRNLVEQETKAMKPARVPNFLCEGLGSGKQEINPAVFAGIQHSFLDDRSACPNHAYGFPISNKKTKKARPAQGSN